MDGMQLTEDESMADLSLCLSVVLCLYFLFNVEFPKNLYNTIRYVEQYLVGHHSEEKKLPLCVSKVHNMLSMWNRQEAACCLAFYWTAT